MNEKVKHKLAESIVNLIKLDLYYEGCGFLMFKIEYPFLKSDSNREFTLRINLGDEESWNFELPASYQLFEYLESVFKIKDSETKDVIRDLVIDNLEYKVRKLREYLLTP
jgi:hypothetical protein